jgi:hypothetical protein
MTTVRNFSQSYISPENGANHFEGFVEVSLPVINRKISELQDSIRQYRISGMDVKLYDLRFQIGYNISYLESVFRTVRSVSNLKNDHSSILIKAMDLKFSNIEYSIYNYSVDNTDPLILGNEFPNIPGLDMVLKFCDPVINDICTFRYDDSKELGTRIIASIVDVIDRLKSEHQNITKDGKEILEYTNAIKVLEWQKKKIVAYTAIHDEDDDSAVGDDN